MRSPQATENGRARPSAGVLSERAARRIGARTSQDLRPDGSVAIKRDLHVFEVDADAASFARAFHEVLRDPESLFGVVRVKRLPDRVGCDFEEGERFQGGFSLQAAIDQRAAPPVRALATRLLRWRPVAALAALVEEAFLSNYGELERIALRGEVHTLVYRYLDGTPIAGRTTYTVEPISPSRCRVTQLLQYQEVNAIALNTFARFGLKFHDAGVYWQVRRAAEHLGARITESSVPPEYLG